MHLESIVSPGPSLTANQFASNHRPAAAEISKSVLSIFCSRCAFQTEDYIFAQSHHHLLAKDRGDARLNWTKSTCGFCSSITTAATAQRANKLKNSGHFVSIKLFSEYNPAPHCSQPRAKPVALKHYLNGAW